jgi:hypothetical protein
MGGWQASAHAPSAHMAFRAALSGTASGKALLPAAAVNSAGRGDRHGRDGRLH